MESSPSYEWHTSTCSAELIFCRTGHIIIHQLITNYWHVSACVVTIRGSSVNLKHHCQKWDSNPRLQGRLRPERSALDRSAILTFFRAVHFLSQYSNFAQNKKLRAKLRLLKTNQVVCPKTTMTLSTRCTWYTALAGDILGGSDSDLLACLCTLAQPLLKLWRIRT